MALTCKILPKILEKDGTFYIETYAGNLDTAEHYAKIFSVIRNWVLEFDVNGDYIECYRCCESILWGEHMVHYGDRFYHGKCWREEQDNYYKT